MTSEWLANTPNGLPLRIIGPHRLLRGFQLTNDLAHADRRVLLRQYIGKIDLDGAQQVRQRPGLTACFVEHVVDFQPWRFDDFLIDLRHFTGFDRHSGFGFQRAVEFDPANAGRQALRQRTQAGADIAQPVVQVVGAGVKQRAFLVWIGQACLVAAQELIPSAYCDSLDGRSQLRLLKLNNGSARARSPSSADCDWERAKSLRSARLRSRT